MVSESVMNTYPSRGPVTVHKTMVFPSVSRLEPSLEVCVEIEAVI